MYLRRVSGQDIVSLVGPDPIHGGGAQPLHLGIAQSDLFNGKQCSLKLLRPLAGYFDQHAWPVESHGCQRAAPYAACIERQQARFVH